jgi:hypothetical protein
MTTRPVAAFTVVMLLALVLLAGCQNESGPIVRVYNRLDQPIHIWAQSNGRPAFDVGGYDIQPGASATISRADIFPGATCAAGALIARSLDGRELGGSSGQVCSGDSWLVDVGGFHHSAPPE